MRASQLHAFVIAAVCALTCAASASAQITVVLSPSSDRSASDTSPTDGVADGLLPDNDTFLRTFGSPAAFRSAVEFPGIPTDSIIESATLFLYDGGTVTGGATLEIHGYAGDGVVTLGDDFAVDNLVTSYVNTSSAVGRNLDVTTFVRSLASNLDDVAGFMVRSQVEGGFAGSDVNSREAAANPPTLTIEYRSAAQVPDLGGTGMVVLIVVLAVAGAFILAKRSV